MKILAFRIREFRSIVDSGWVRFSSDGVTAFVGQNESGKSSILDALYYSLSNENPGEDDIRAEGELPMVDFKIELSSSRVQGKLLNISPAQLLILEKFISDSNNKIEISVVWDRNIPSEQSPFKRKYILSSGDLDKKLSPTASFGSAIGALSEVILDADPNTRKQREEGKVKTFAKLNSRMFAQAVWQELPLGVLFRDAEYELPNHVDIDSNGVPAGPGSEAASHFLKIAGIDLTQLLKKDKRTLESSLRRANDKVTDDFRKFWTQTVGKGELLSIQIQIDRHADRDLDRAGKPYLVFWVLDGNTQLYPKQRSQGVRWFIAFYLQLKSSEIDGLERIFLLDEPGSNLHSRAQADVLRLINVLSKSSSNIVYSTHSPELIEYSKLYRVRAVQRQDNAEYSPTSVIDAHELGTASTDTLSPILSAMGADLSHQQVIQKSNNVLLEEMSGFYYLSSFWKLTGQIKKAHFIAATGVNKIEGLANMFRGWGLEFIVAIDDDKQGREVYKSMKREHYGDDAVLANTELVKLPNCPSIEDVFSSTDFAKHIWCDENLHIDGSIGEFLKKSGRSKPVLAFTFARKVDSGEISFKDFDEITSHSMLAVVEAIASRLKE